MATIYDISIIIKGNTCSFYDYDSTIIPQKDDIIAFDETTYIKVLYRIHTVTDTKRVVVVGEFAKL